MRRLLKKIRIFINPDIYSIIKPLLDKYCTGNGLEIGAGKHPYGEKSRTIFLDKFTDNKDGTPRPDIVSDATDIPREDASFDYVISSHVLEHMQDAIGALKEWVRVIKPNGVLFLVLPHGDRTFDRHREKTSLDHHIDDHKNLIPSQPDYSHNEEIKIGWSKNENAIADSVNYEKDWGVSTWDFEFRLRNGVIHFHVWTQNEIVQLLQYLELKILWVAEEAPERTDSFVVVARK